MSRNIGFDAVFAKPSAAAGGGGGLAVTQDFFPTNYSPLTDALGFLRPAVPTGLDGYLQSKICYTTFNIRKDQEPVAFYLVVSSDPNSPRSSLTISFAEATWANWTDGEDPGDNITSKSATAYPVDSGEVLNYVDITDIFAGAAAGDICSLRSDPSPVMLHWGVLVVYE